MFSERSIRVPRLGGEPYPQTILRSLRASDPPCVSKPTLRKAAVRSTLAFVREREASSRCQSPKRNLGLAAGRACTPRAKLEKLLITVLHLNLANATMHVSSHFQPSMSSSL
ncbi:hypothetical protein CEXT_627231 [Caerostris extrusa]|uniref:Uncharacterized protein n=1 Tax=Caerostris extrusa TaxID=172846 RepID=A0AAV4R2V5_CAEEX|nr:hypothetical protein CEXT_627231 [Caerostris extrusa]